MRRVLLRLSILAAVLGLAVPFAVGAIADVPGSLPKPTRPSWLDPDNIGVPNLMPARIRVVGANGVLKGWVDSAQLMAGPVETGSDPASIPLYAGETGPITVGTYSLAGGSNTVVQDCDDSLVPAGDC